ncbi:MAG: hypothetical protein ACOCUY_03690 [Verrucomicrobiota bacterium]
MLKEVVAMLGLIVAVCAGSAHGAEVTLDFINNNDTDVSGGTLQNPDGTSLTWDDVDEEESYAFQIVDIESTGSVGITAEARRDDLNFLSNGLADGSTGYNEAEEGTDFTFDRAVTITEMDWCSFTSGGSDSVKLMLDDVSLGTFGQDDVSGGIDFTDTNPARMSINVPAGSTFSLEYEGGDFKLERLTFTIPEPAAASLIILGGTALLCRRRR